MADSTSPKNPSTSGRWLPAHWWGRLLLVTPLGVLLYVRLGDLAGDRGTQNVFSLMLTIVFALFWLAWFLVASGQPWRRRVGVFVGLAVAVGVFFALFRFDRLTGAMMPVFVSRFADAPAADGEDLATTPDPSVGSVDLVTETADDSPEYLGPNRRPEIDHVRLAADWDAREPELAWRREVGAGWSGFAVRNEVALTLEQRGDQEVVTCYAVTTGEPCWSTPLGAVQYESLVTGDGPRTTPTIHEGAVYVLGTQGHLAALDGATGEALWRVEIEEVLGLDLDPETRAKILPYGRSNSPLVTSDGQGRDLVVAPGGGTPEAGFVSLVAFDLETGEEVWRGGDRQISCASPTAAEVAGRFQVLSVDADRVAGYEPSTGEVLWSHPWPGDTAANANVSQPVPVGSNRVFVSKGYGVGAALLELVANDEGGFTVREIWHESRSLRTKFTNVAIHEGTVYGLSDGILEAVDLATGEREWKRGRYQQGQLLRVGDHLLVVSESGEVHLVEATPDEANSVLGSFQAVDGKTWNPPALYGDLLLVRNSSEATAWRLPLAE